GSGSGLKTRLLLDHLPDPASYIPVDVAREQLVAWTRQLAHDYPDLAVWPVCADYTRDLEWLELPPDSSRRILLFFPGSTIGNFEPQEAVDFLRRLRTMCGPSAGLLLGVDLKKDLEVLLPAYNDARGITAEFNLNLLVRANRELGAGFNPAQFRHHAWYNQRAGRIEMHLVSQRPQIVAVGNTSFFFDAGESIVTEYSYKYSLDGFRRLAARAGWEVTRCWTDEERWFSVQYLQPSPRKRTVFKKR
ncbi:MAG TPA: L-histidine N(alpha)-methyltransferase, partial [Candidatus Sulfotelmatobacter sp.]|nr:L-histidine N(alpha)-methyltransferase [Candidatus Sulfotelmatobacter sp.]